MVMAIGDGGVMGMAIGDGGVTERWWRRCGGDVVAICESMAIVDDMAMVDGGDESDYDHALLRTAEWAIMLRADQVSHKATSLQGESWGRG